MANPNGNPDIVELGKNTRFTAEDSNRAAECGKKGAEAFKENLAKKKTLTETLQAALEDETVKKSLAAAIINKALKGDVKAWALIRDTIGEKPVDKVEVNATTDEALKEFEDWLYGQETDSGTDQE